MDFFSLYGCIYGFFPNLINIFLRIDIYNQYQNINENDLLFVSLELFKISIDYNNFLMYYFHHILFLLL